MRIPGAAAAVAPHPRSNDLAEGNYISPRQSRGGAKPAPKQSAFLRGHARQYLLSFSSSSVKFTSFPGIKSQRECDPSVQEYNSGRYCRLRPFLKIHCFKAGFDCLDAAAALDTLDTWGSSH